MAGIYHELLQRIAADPSQRDGGPAVAADRADKLRVGRPALRWRRRARWTPGDVADDGATSSSCGGGLAGISAALRCADEGAQVVLLEARPRLGGMAAFSFRRGELSSTTASTSSCAAARPTAGCSTGSASRGARVLQPRLDIPVLRPGRPRRRGCPHARRARAGAPDRGAGRATGCCRRPTGCGPRGARSRCACSTRPTATLDDADARRLPAPARAERRRRSTRCGASSPRPR